MPRRPRIATGGYVYHVLNRGVGRMALFHDDADYLAFLRILAKAGEDRPGIGLLAYCLMPNHWHMVLKPSQDGQLSDFMRWLTVTHTQRWHAHRQSAGSGPVYQGRFKSFPVQEDNHCLMLLRYVERNALSAGLAAHAQDWRWGSLWQREQVKRNAGVLDSGTWPMLASWPVDRPRRWVEMVNRPLSDAQADAVKRSLHRSAPLGDAAWMTHTARTLSLESTLRPRGRPRKAEVKA